jgi:hypothetical protein
MRASYRPLEDNVCKSCVTAGQRTFLLQKRIYINCVIALDHTLRLTELFELHIFSSCLSDAIFDNLLPPNSALAR